MMGEQGTASLSPPRSVSPEEALTHEARRALINPSMRSPPRTRYLPHPCPALPSTVPTWGLLGTDPHSQTTASPFFRRLCAACDRRGDRFQSNFLLHFSVFEESSSSQGWGKIVAQYIHSQWVCLSFLLRRYHTLIPAPESGALEPYLPAVQMPGHTLQSALDALAILPADRVLPVFRCMKVLVPKVRRREAGMGRGGVRTAWSGT